MSRNMQTRISGNVQTRRQMPRQSPLVQQKLQASASAAANTGHLATREEYNHLISLRDGYKATAIAYSRSGNKAKALSMLRISKQLSLMTKAVEENRPVDLDGLPPMPPKISLPPSRRAAPTPHSARSPTHNTAMTQIDAAPSRERVHPEIEYRLEQLSLHPPSSSSSFSGGGTVSIIPVPSQDADVARLFDAPTSASSTMDALQQRLDKYKSTMDAATAEGNPSKARRLGRIVKQYENAISATSKGVDFDYDSLPSPPGYPPIPRVSHRTVIQVTHQPSKSQAPPVPVQQRPERPKTELNAKVDLLTHQQNVLKKGAIASRESGDKSRALELFRMAKGLDTIIEAVKCGLPYDPQSIPPHLNQVVNEVERTILPNRS